MGGTSNTSVQYRYFYDQYIVGTSMQYR